MADRPGRATAGRWLATPYGLAGRLLRGSFIAVAAVLWTLVLVRIARRDISS